MTHIENVIVGGGPAGLQMGQHFAASGRDYLIIEAGERPGTFFETFPRHRQLISINKRFNLYSSPAFNLRHDWNSLLTEGGSGPLFTSYSERLFPRADEMVRYLGDYCSFHGLRLRTGTRVRSVRRSGDGFVVGLDGESVTADRVFLATGPVTPRVPDVEGIELAASYSDHDLDERAYRNRKVAIIGRGNSAFEVANHLAAEAAIVHILVAEPVRHAWNTHFAGDLRAVNNTVLDMYQLKSLHATLSYRVRRISRADSGMLAVDIEEELPNWDPPVVQRRTLEYHDVIHCAGWRFADTDLFEPGEVPDTSHSGKYFSLSPWWETSVEGVYCIGTSMQQRDRKAASSFIHGFRYNVRSLYRHIEEQVYGAEPDRLTLRVHDEPSLTRAADVLLRRLSTTSGLYQQFGVLADVVTCRSSEATVTSEVPYEVALDATRDPDNDAVVLMTLEYGFDRYPSEVSALDFIRPFDPAAPECSAFLHPVFRLYRGGELVQESHLGESFDMRWDAETVHDTDDVGHRGIVKQVLNRALDVSSTCFDTGYARLKRAANLRPLERAVHTVGSSTPSGDGPSCSFRY